jgi:preprotein translocase subunit Sec61beta
MLSMSSRSPAQALLDYPLWRTPSILKLKLTFVSVGLYTDESPGLKVDPVVVLVLSIVFIFSVVALHGMRQIVTTAFRAPN